MNGPALASRLREMFASHDVELEDDEEDWLVTDGDFPAIRATWHAGRGDEPGHLDIDVVAAEERTIELSYPGYGERGCRDALDDFERQALYPLLAACWYVTDDRKVDISAFDSGLNTWDVFAGKPGLRGVADIPTSVRDAVHAALRAQSLTAELHWVNLFHARDADGNERALATLDNQPWAAGVTALSSGDWPKAENSARWLLLVDVRDY